MSKTAARSQRDEASLANDRRRRLLTAATSIVGGAGLVATAYPFVDSMEPSERVKAFGGPVTADFSRLGPGAMITVAWRGKPIWVMRRTPEMIAALRRPNPALADPKSRRSEQPKSCDNPTRSVRPDVFVAVGVCTHLGCTPNLKLNDPALDARVNEPGAFLCPCHGSVFDLAGRVIKNVPAPVNLVIPNYRFTGPSVVEVG